MGTSFTRPTLVGNINNSFKPSAIETTAASVSNLGPDADAFDIIHALGHFDLATDAALAEYKAGLAIPPINRAILALAFQASVTGKIPLSFAIVGGHAEAVQVTVSDKLISVVLTRVD